MSVQTVLIHTDSAGDFTYERPFKGQILGIRLNLGDLSTPNVDVNDGLFSVSILSVNGVAADSVWYPGGILNDADGSAGDGIAPAVIMGTLEVIIAGGGDTKKGSISFLTAR